MPQKYSYSSMVVPKIPLKFEVMSSNSINFIFYFLISDGARATPRQ